jgi:hypothetical protein
LELTTAHERAAKIDALSIARAAHHGKPDQLKQMIKDLKNPCL